MKYDDKMMGTEDKELKCIEPNCQMIFTFSVGEQQFFKEKNLQHAPNRCPDCRKKRRAAREQQ